MQPIESGITGETAVPDSLVFLLIAAWWLFILPWTSGVHGSERMQYFAKGFALSPTFLLSLFMSLRVVSATTRFATILRDHQQKEATYRLALLFHQLFCTVLWSSTLFFGLPELYKGVASFEWGFLGFTLGAFASELTILRPNADGPTWTHHACTVGLLCLLILVASTPTIPHYYDDDIQQHQTDINLSAVVHFCAVACPSYTCIPKLCRKLRLLSPAGTDIVWCGALLLWVFVRVRALHGTYGLGFYRLRDMTFPSWEEETLFSSSYYVSVVVTVLLLAVYCINGYWAYKKLKSAKDVVEKTVAKVWQGRSHSRSVEGSVSSTRG